MVSGLGFRASRELRGWRLGFEGLGFRVSGSLGFLGFVGFESWVAGLGGGGGCSSSSRDRAGSGRANVSPVCSKSRVKSLGLNASPKP